MSEPIVITADQVVARKNGYVSYVTDHGDLRKAREELVTIKPEGASAIPADPPEQDSLPLAAEEMPEPKDTPSPDHVPEPDPQPVKAKSPRKERPVATAQARPAPKAKTAPKPALKAKTSPKVAAKPAPKKAANGAKAPRETPAGVRTIGGKVVDISHYEKSKAPGGGTSYNNGDVVAQLLEGKDLDACYGIAAKKLKVEEKELRAKYGHLNLGMQRMSLGNRLRAVMIPKEAK